MIDLLETAAHIAAALQLKKAGSGHNWRGECPACHDKGKSFSLTAKPDSLLVHCFACGDQNAVISAIRAIDPALWPANMPASDGDTSTRTPWESARMGDLIKRPPVAWLIKNVLPARGIIALSGEPGSGKSFLALDMVRAILTPGKNVRWMGRRVKDTCAVHYVAGEGGTGFGQRARACQRISMDAEWRTFGLLEMPMNFTNKADVDKLIEVIERDGRQYGPTGLLIVDTVAQTMRGVDENTNDGMGQYLDGVGRVVAYFNFCTLLIHHTGKDVTRGHRGHSSFLGNIDGEMFVEVERTKPERDSGERAKPTGIKTIFTGKMKDGEGYQDIGRFMLDPITLERDEDGDDITSCVVRETGARPGE